MFHFVLVPWDLKSSKWSSKRNLEAGNKIRKQGTWQSIQHLDRTNLLLHWFVPSFKSSTPLYFLTSKVLVLRSRSSLKERTKKYDIREEGGTGVFTTLSNSGIPSCDIACRIIIRWAITTSFQPSGAILTRRCCHKVRARAPCSVKELYLSTSYQWHLGKKWGGRCKQWNQSIPDKFQFYSDIFVNKI